MSTKSSLFSPERKQAGGTFTKMRAGMINMSQITAASSKDAAVANLQGLFRQDMNEIAISLKDH